MLINEIILEEYSAADYETIELFESAEHWRMTNTRAFKKGWKKYKNELRVVDSLNHLMGFIKKHKQIPAMKDYPPEYNVHILKRMKSGLQGTYWAHLKGQNIGLLFDIEHGELHLIHIGTHQTIGL